jgi:hypothetical protein
MKISSTIRWGLGLAVIFAHEHLNRLSRTRYLPRLMILMGQRPLHAHGVSSSPKDWRRCPVDFSDIGEEGLLWIWVWRGRRQGD